LLAALLFAGCGSSFEPPFPTATGPTGQLPDAQPWTPGKPTLIAVAPGAMAVGDDLTVLAENIVPVGRGYPLLVIRGTYFDDKGKTFPVDLQVKARRRGTSKVSWKLYPTISFHPEGTALGSFVGEVRLINVTTDGAQLPSEPFPSRIDVKPSLIPRVVRPRASECGSVVEGTLEDTRMTFAVEAVGLRPGTADAPLKFSWTFLTRHWKIEFANDTTDPESIFRDKGEGAIILDDEVKEGITSAIQGDGQKSVIVKAAANAWDNFWGNKRLRTLATKVVPEDGNNYEASVHVSAVDASGKAVAIAIPIDVHRVADMIYDGTSKIAEREAPERVTDCIPANDYGQQVSYREDQSTSRQRSVDFQYHASAAVSSGLPTNPFALGVNFSAGFGVSTSGVVSSSQSSGLDISGQIYPGMYGAFYRQVSKVLRIGQLVGYNECGNTVDLGQAILTDWIFTPDLAIGPSCPPQTKLQPAQKFM
jgi:hypothetical protein